jgi:general secretion pathway protein A
MYNAYFRLNESPFSIAPDPRFLFMSARHREALAHLMYGVSGEGGFVVLTGEVGTGKTTICRCLLEQVPDDCDVAFIVNPGLSAVEMLAAICDELRIGYPENLNIKGYVDRFNSYLLKGNAAGRKTVLIIDEAQLLDPKVLELLRLLTNLETSRRKLLQIVLLGQPELVTLLARSDLRQVAQRVVARYHLQHLSKIEVSAYVAHRLGVAGSQTKLIPESLMGLLFRRTGGVPRLINLVCDRALLGAYVEGKQVVTEPVLRKAAAEVLGTRKSRTPRIAAAIAAIALLVAAGAWYAVHRAAVPPPTVSQPAESATAQSPEGPSKAPALSAAGSAVSDFAPRDVAATTPMVEAAPLLHAGQTPEQAEAAAFRAVLARFGQIYSPHGRSRGCRYVEAAGLSCFSAQGNTEVFQTYNPPIILYLQRDGQRFPVVLDGLQGHQATFIVAGQSRSAPIESLEGLWTGEFVVLWRPPPGVPKRLELGARGPAVAWLADALAVVSGAEQQQRVDRFDAALQEKLKAFQAQEGLKVTGVAGPSTLLRLSHRIDQRLVGQAAQTGKR